MAMDQRATTYRPGAPYWLTIACAYANKPYVDAHRRCDRQFDPVPNGDAHGHADAANLLPSGDSGRNAVSDADRATKTDDPNANT